MTDFLIKSSLSLVTLLLVYFFVLEKEKMHQFNRFYLLFSLVFSFAIPFITIERMEEITTPIFQNHAIQINQGSAVFVEETNYFPIVFWSIYGGVTLLLSIRFARNILKIISKIKWNPKINHQQATLVLLKEKVLPHSFLNYIFVSEIEYNQQKIEDELFSHELTHVSQKHSLDVLLIEILKTVFWFNPVFIFYKKAIQLNHEFLADAKVINSYHNISFYQNLLLSKANQNQPLNLASNLTFLLTKKRLIMMTKTTSKTKALAKKVLLLPFIFGLVYFLCFKTIAQEKMTTTAVQKPEKEQTSTERRDEYYAGVRIIFKDCSKKIIVDKQYEELTSEEKDKYVPPYVPTPIIEKSPTEKEFSDFKNTTKYAVWIDGKNSPNTQLNQYAASDFVYFSGSSVSKNARSKKFPQPFQFHFYTKAYFDKNLKNSWKKFGGKEIISSLNCKDKWDKTANFEKSVESQKAVQATEKTLPEYQGGTPEFYKFFGENYKIPSDFKGNGKIYLSFMVETDGSLSEIRVLRDLGFGTGAEAVRVLKLSPKWIPGKEDGKVVRMNFALPIALQEK